MIGCAARYPPWVLLLEGNIRGSLYDQANATLSASTRKQILYDLQTLDFNTGGYIIPAFIDALDAYSTQITGYAAGKVGQPLSNLNFEDWAFV